MSWSADRIAAQMTAEKGTYDLARARDLLVLAPIIASSLAMTWEVGRFVPIGGFHYFSFAEHLVSASTALPQAITVTFFCCFVLIPLLRWIDQDNNSLSTRQRFLLLSFASFVSILSSIGQTYQMGLRFNIVLVYAAIALVFLNLLFLRIPWNSLYALGAIAAFFILFTLLLSAERLAAELSTLQADDPSLALVTTKIGTKKGAVIMSGERGVLIYRPDVKRLSFEKTDEIRSIEWLP